MLPCGTWDHMMRSQMPCGSKLVEICEVAKQAAAPMCRPPTSSNCRATTQSIICALLHLGRQNARFGPPRGSGKEGIQEGACSAAMMIVFHPQAERKLIAAGGTETSLPPGRPQRAPRSSVRCRQTRHQTECLSYPCGKLGDPQAGV